jgi:hypothetical protein
MEEQFQPHSIANALLEACRGVNNLPKWARACNPHRVTADMLDQLRGAWLTGVHRQNREIDSAGRAAYVKPAPPGRDARGRLLPGGRHIEASDGKCWKATQGKTWHIEAYAEITCGWCGQVVMRVKCGRPLYCSLACRRRKKYVNDKAARGELPGKPLGPRPGSGTGRNHRGRIPCAHCYGLGSVLAPRAA